MLTDETWMDAQRSWPIIDAGHVLYTTPQGNAVTLSWLHRNPRDGMCLPLPVRIVECKN